MFGGGDSLKSSEGAESLRHPQHSLAVARRRPRIAPKLPQIPIPTIPQLPQIQTSPIPQLPEI